MPRLIWVTASLLTLFIPACGQGSQSPGSPPQQVAAQGGQLVTIETFAGDHAAARALTIYLPPGYADGDADYPVIYAQDGQNLFEPGYSYGGEAWEVDAAMDRLIASGAIEPAIIVGLWNTPRRREDYAPQDLVESLPADEAALVFETPFAIPLANGYADYIALEVKSYIDATYRTRPDPSSTSLMGSSMGGLISLYTLSRHPDVFGQAAGLSTHWPIRVSGRLSGAEAERWQAMLIPYWRSFLADAPLDAEYHRLWLDHGTINLDALYPPYQEAIDPALAARGFIPGPDFVSRVYEGADHNEAAWRARIDEVLIFLLGERD